MFCSLNFSETTSSNTNWQLTLTSQNERFSCCHYHYLQRVATDSSGFMLKRDWNEFWPQQCDTPVMEAHYLLAAFQNGKHHLHGLWLQKVLSRSSMCHWSRCGSQDNFHCLRQLEANLILTWQPKDKDSLLLFCTVLPKSSQNASAFINPAVVI